MPYALIRSAAATCLVLGVIALATTPAPAQERARATFGPKASPSAILSPPAMVAPDATDFIGAVVGGGSWGAGLGVVGGFGLGFLAENFFHEGSISVGATTGRYTRNGALAGFAAGAAIGIAAFWLDEVISAGTDPP